MTNNKTTEKWYTIDCEGSLECSNDFHQLFEQWLQSYIDFEKEENNDPEMIQYFTEVKTMFMDKAKKVKSDSSYRKLVSEHYEYLYKTWDHNCGYFNLRITKECLC